MGELRGTQIQPRDLAARGYELGWVDLFDLTTMVAITLAESQGYDRAFNDNTVPPDETRKGLDGKTYTEGEVWQRDCGVMQIGIAGSEIGTPREEALYDWRSNMVRGWTLYLQRGWQPWAAYGGKVYLRDSYIKRAVRGVGNFAAEKLLLLPTDLLSGKPYVHTLETPVLDYYYRVATMAETARAAHAKTVALKGKQTSAANKVLADDIAHLLAQIIAEPKK